MGTHKSESIDAAARRAVLAELETFRVKQKAPLDVGAFDAGEAFKPRLDK